MSQAGALTRARALRDELRKRGVPVSIEIQQGRPGTPNNRWFDDRFIGSMGHHIVSTRNTGGLTPGLSLIKRGRSDVPGPLANGYLGWDGVARIICMGWANHPGAGGPYTLPGGRIPLNGARPYLFGWEIEGGINLSDWTPAFRQLMGKCHAATLAWLKRDERSHIEHKTWAPTRKIDRLGYSLTGARNELKPHLKVTPEDDMPAPRDWTAADWAAIRKGLHNDDKYAGNRINILSGKSEDWHDHVNTLRLERATNPVPPNGWMAERWSDIPEGGYRPEIYGRAAYGHARRAAEGIEVTVTPLLEQLVAAQGGAHRDEVLADIQSKLHQAQQERLAIANRLDEQSAALVDVRAVLEEYQSGVLDPQELADALIRRFQLPADEES